MTTEGPRQYAAVTAVEYYLPAGVLTNEDLARQYPQWSVDKIFAKTGIRTRHIAAPDETVSDMGVEAARRLFAAGRCGPREIDLLVFCTQTPDYALPTTACIVQDRLGLATACAAFDVNLGCSGFVYGLGMAKGLLETGQARKALLITAETYSKWLADGDRTVRTIFGDGAAATLIELVEGADGPEPIGPFVYGTDGRGYDRLIVHGSGGKAIDDKARRSMPPGHAESRLYMDGPEVFTFTLRTVPEAFGRLLAAAGMSLEQIDLVVFHQANAYILEHLRDRLGIPPEKFVVDVMDHGNTVSSTIPIALRDASEAGRLRRDMTVAVVGFGVGYSWAAAKLIWKG